VKYLKYDRVDGRGASNAHGITRDANGDLWFDINPGRRSLGKLETKTDTFKVYETPPPMSPLGGAVTMDVDGKGKIWASAPDGVVIFDPASEKFTDFKSKAPYQNTKGTNMTHGAAGDRDGNGRWAQMAFDTVGKAGVATHSTSEVVLPSLKDEIARIPAPAKAFYDSFNQLTVNNPLPWSEGPRRMGTDKNADVLWVGNSWGSSLARIDTKTADDDRAVPRSGLSAVPHRGRQEPQRAGQHVGDGPHRPLQSHHCGVVVLRYAGSRDRNPPRLAAPAARPGHQGHRAALPQQQDGRDDAAHRGRNRGPQGAGIEVARGAAGGIQAVGTKNFRALATGLGFFIF
jgi:hypothetical protein